MSNIEKTLSIIKPDAVERNLVDNIKNIFMKNSLKIQETKKFKLQRKKHLNFIKFISQNHFIMIYVLIYHLGQ